jgi:farnesyl diphosphate synthase
MSSVSSSGTPLQPDFDLDAWVGQRLAQVERALEQWVTADAPQGLDHGAPAQLVEAMRYAVLDGGKRLRPLLVLAAHEAVQRDGQASASDVNAALRAACAVELIHAYSLVHDDMPCMDNDVLRRGKPTVHVQFGEASALLAGDALQALAFELLTPQDGSVAHATQARLCAVLARAAGSAGMAGGQAIDLASVGLPLTESQLREMHELKTGALLQASVMMGACCGAPSPGRRRCIADLWCSHRAGVPGGRRHTGRHRRFQHPGQNCRQGRRQQQTHLCFPDGPAGQPAVCAAPAAPALGALECSGLAQTRALRALANMVVNRAS